MAANNQPVLGKRKIMRRGNVVFTYIVDSNCQALRQSWARTKRVMVG